MAKYKVEISGINTGDLKTLSHEEQKALFLKVKEGDLFARDLLVEGNLKLVLSILKRFNNKCDNMDDLFQIGCVGLLKAIDNFDLSHEVKFSTYAVPMILGELRRFSRDYQPLRVSRSLRDLAYKSMQAKERLTNKNQREPTVEEIAKEIGAKRSDVVTALESVSDPVSLYEPVYSDAGDTLFVLDQIGDHNDASDWLEEISIKEAIKSLLPREKNIIYLRFFQGKTQVEVANDIGISQAQVSRLEKGALKKIKGQM